MIATGAALLLLQAGPPTTAHDVAVVEAVESENAATLSTGVNMAAIVKRADAQDRYLDCAHDRLQHFLNQNEPALTLARAAMDTCGSTRQGFVDATYASIDERGEAQAWIAETERAMERQLSATVILFRSDYPTGSF